MIKLSKNSKMGWLSDKFVELPCDGCEDRNVRCHSRCEKYISARKKQDEWLEKVRKIKDQKIHMIEIAIKMKKKFRNHKTKN